MANTAYATLEIIPSLKGVQGKIEQGLAPAGAAGTSAGRSIGSKIIGGIGTAAKIGAVAIGGILGTAIYKGFGRLTAIENATAKLTGLGNSAGTVKTIMNDALSSVKGTAFGLDEAATVAATATAAGVKPGKELQRTLGLVADAATISGVSLGEMGAIFNKVASSNKIQGDTIAQLNDQGIPIVQLLGKQLGVTGDEVTKLASKGKIDFATFQKAMESGLGGAALKSGNTTQGAFKNMNAALGRFGATLLKGVFPIAKEVFGGITTFLDDLTSSSAPAIEAISNKLVGAFRTLKPIVAAFYAGFTGKKVDPLSAFAGFAAKGATIRNVFSRIAAGAVGLYDIIVKGDFTGNFRKAFNLEEDSKAVEVIFRIRNAIVGLFDLVVKGDFTGKLRSAFNVEEDGAFVGFILDARNAVKSFFADLKSGSGSALSGDFTQIGASAKELGPIFGDALKIFRDVTSSLPSLSEVVHGVAVAMGFLADHTGALTVVLTALAVGYGAVKVAQTLSQVAFIADLPIRAAAVVANLALARSNNALALAIRGVTGATETSRIAQIGNAISTAAAWVASTARTIGSLALQAAAFIAQRVVMVASTVATFALAGAQAALNFVLAANPIGLLIIAIAALVVGIVIAYKNSETFRNIVNAAWAAIKNVVSSVVNYLAKAVPGVFAAIKFAFLNFTILGLVINHWGQIVSVIRGAISNIGAAIGFFASLPGRFAGWFSGVVSAVSSRISQVVNIARGLPGQMVSALGNLGGLLLGAGQRLIQGLIDGIMSKIGAVTGAISSVAQTIKDHLPGSPIRTGPLVSWNNGGAGKRLGALLAGGIESSTPRVQQAMESLVTPVAFKSIDRSVGRAGVSSASAAGGTSVTFNGNVGWQPDEVASRIAVKQRDAFTARSLRVAVG